MHRASLLSWAVLALLVAVPSVADAQTDGSRRDRLSGSYEFQNVRVRGLGNAYIGGGSGNGALYANPAGLVTTALYSLQGGYQHQTLRSGNAIHASIVDSKTNGALAAGFAYSFGFSPGEDDAASDNVRDHDIRAGVAVPLVPQSLALGVAGHFTARSRGRIATADGETADLTLRGVTADVGLMAAFNGMFSLGVVGKNLFAVDEARDLRRGIGAGAGLFLGNFHLEAEYRGDYRHSITRLIGSGEDAQSETLLPGDFGHGVAVGAEYVVAQVPLRLGFSRLPFDDNRISAGLGYRSSVFGLDAAFEQNLSNSDDRVISFSFSGQF
jgi:hypothetical protein